MFLQPTAGSVAAIAVGAGRTVTFGRDSADMQRPDIGITDVHISREQGRLSLQGADALLLEVCGSGRTRVIRPRLLVVKNAPLKRLVLKCRLVDAEEGT